MSLAEPRYLLDVNVLVALCDEEHVHHGLVTRWFGRLAGRWSTCAFTEAGFLRVSMNPRVSGMTMEEANEVLASFAMHPGFEFWAEHDQWQKISALFGERIFGHQQITNAYLLGLAVKKDGVLVTMDAGVKYLAGEKYGQNVLVLA